MQWWWCWWCQKLFLPWLLSQLDNSKYDVKINTENNENNNKNNKKIVTEIIITQDSSGARAWQQIFLHSCPFPSTPPAWLCVHGFVCMAVCAWLCVHGCWCAWLCVAVVCTPVGVAVVCIAVVCMAVGVAVVCTPVGVAVVCMAVCGCGVHGCGGMLLFEL